MIRGIHHRVAVAVLLLGGALCLAGCTPGSQTTPTEDRTGHVAAPGTAGQATGGVLAGSADGEDFGYPLIAPTPAGEKILVSASMRTGVGQIAMTPPTEGALVTVQVACRGTGTIRVGVWSVGYDSIACHPGGDAFETSTVRMVTYRTGGAAPTLDARAYAVSVTADQRQQWAITVSERPASSSGSPTPMSTRR